MPKLRKKTGQFQNSEQVGYSQGAGQEVGRLRTDPSHPANAERNAELARRQQAAQPRPRPAGESWWEHPDLGRF